MTHIYGNAVPVQKYSINQSLQSIIYLLITHQMVSNMSIKTRRTGQPGTRCTYVCLIKHTKFREAVEKQVQMSKMKAIKWPTTERKTIQGRKLKNLQECIPTPLYQWFYVIIMFNNYENARLHCVFLPIDSC